MRINILERIKEVLEKEIIQRNYTSLRYVLFNKSSKLAHATHLYYENNKYYIENRDERGELIGNPYIFADFSKAKKCFLEVLGEVVVLNSYYNNTFGEVPYDSPLWSKSSDDVNIPLVSSNLESRDINKIRMKNRMKNRNNNRINSGIRKRRKNLTLKDIVSDNEAVCEGNKKYSYYPYSNSMRKNESQKRLAYKSVGNNTYTPSQHL